jgi:MFS family permease
MYAFYSEDSTKAADKDFNIRLAIKDFSYDNYCLLVGDMVQLIYAFFVLFTGSLSDFIDRKTLICIACFGWTTCTYLSAYAENFNQLFVLKILINFFSAFQGPCSYSLLTDWVKPGERTLAYAFYALGV